PPSFSSLALRGALPSFPENEGGAEGVARPRALRALDHPDLGAQAGLAALNRLSQVRRKFLLHRHVFRAAGQPRVPEDQHALLVRSEEHTSELQSRENLV